MIFFLVFQFQPKLEMKNGREKERGENLKFTKA